MPSFICLAVELAAIAVGVARRRGAEDFVWDLCYGL